MTRAPAVVIATDLADFEAGDEIEARIGKAWCPAIVIAHASFFGIDCVEVITQYPLVCERLWLPNRTQARWAKVAA